jgi:hypothetical protein
MWQTVFVLLIAVGTAIYLVRHYTKVYRGEESACSSCTECCPARGKANVEPCECTYSHGESHGTKDRSQA